jgi:DNA-binding response OmpR family regulator
MEAPTILIADDHAVCMQLLRACLTSSGYRVLCAQDGREALTLMETERPQLVILDVMMPVMDGMEVLRRAKDDPSLAKIPAIMVTSREQQADILDAVKLGAADYMIKPFVPTELLARVTRIISDRKSAA